MLLWEDVSSQTIVSLIGSHISYIPTWQSQYMKMEAAHCWSTSSIPVSSVWCERPFTKTVAGGGISKQVFFSPPPIKKGIFVAHQHSHFPFMIPSQPILVALRMAPLAR